jgi:hypothetical protein
MPSHSETQREQATEFEELRRLSPKVTGGLLRMRQGAYRDAAVAGKYKLLTAMAISMRTLYSRLRPDGG